MADDPADWLATLEKARATGALSVRHGDTMMTYRSLAEIDSIIRTLKTGGAGSGSGSAVISPFGPRLRYPRQLTKGL